MSDRACSARKPRGMQGMTGSWRMPLNIEAYPLAPAVSMSTAGGATMTYRTILVDLTADGPVEARLDVARSLASHFDAALVGMHVMPEPFVQLPMWEGGGAVYVLPEVIEAQRKVNQEAKERVRAAFDRACGVEPTVRWREAEGDPVRLLAEAAHASDLVIASRGGALGTAEQLVTATGVPVLVLPPEPPRDFGRVALVAWKDAPEAARAAHDALPFLQRTAADRVVLCAVGHDAAAGLDAAAAMLERHGVPVQPERVDRADGRSTGEILLAQAAAYGADLLVMGAYGHARVRELVFGGVTRHVLHAATLPVLFSG
jgi:nucleotide-binding universal stress UspA family protein